MLLIVRTSRSMYVATQERSQSLGSSFRSKMRGYPPARMVSSRVFG